MKQLLDTLSDALPDSMEVDHNDFSKRLKQIARQPVKKNSMHLRRSQAPNDIREHLDMLFYRGFIRYATAQWLKCYPRYLDTIEKRIEKLQYS